MVVASADRAAMVSCCSVVWGCSSIGWLVGWFVVGGCSRRSTMQNEMDGSHDD